jgi:hypothetical protein
VRQDVRLPAEAEEIGIGWQQFTRPSWCVAVVQSVHKIQRNVLGIQFEWRLFHK